MAFCAGAWAWCCLGDRGNALTNDEARRKLKELAQLVKNDFLLCAVMYGISSKSSESSNGILSCMRRSRLSLLASFSSSTTSAWMVASLCISFTTNGTQGNTYNPCT
eukprot:TRINITY_DN6904_c0_g1_i1.p1 TRINITY_DN6904_c0_g1~~TRINITY_DN6904_c0_g1_i1.p1  ORF type:complete len:107 (+),score=9.91 TRINITY_DN6904_c0_g1_i1:658-978(+)